MILDKIKLLLEISENDKDALLNTLIELCTIQALTYAHREEMNEIMDNIVVLMVVEKYNKLGSEGITSRSFSGVSESIKDDYSNEIIHLLNTQRRLRVL